MASKIVASIIVFFGYDEAPTQSSLPCLIVKIFTFDYLDGFEQDLVLKPGSNKLIRRHVLAVGRIKIFGFVAGKLKKSNRLEWLVV